MALACHFLLEALAAPGAYTPLWTSGGNDPLLVRPWGPTPLGTRILDALEHGPDRLVIVSDGWDNAPPGLAGEVLRVWRARIDPHRRTAVVHVNPVYEADGFDVRRLAPSGRQPASATPRICPRWWRSRSSRRGVRGRRHCTPIWTVRSHDS